MSEAGVSGTAAGPVMSRDEATAALQRALELSRDLLEAADGGEAERVVSLDAERLRLIKSARPTLMPMNEKDQAVLRQIADLNDRSLGLMEHRLRAKCRDMDMLSAGRRALRAYTNHRP
ncbi:MAG TPA: hypothetical protein VHY75_09555 [Steroidobacteraceae bacterium]|jgi:hypothetical protein|nr:hypothetical protein [Steroidobacteraceae bacterium]